MGFSITFIDELGEDDEQIGRIEAPGLLETFYSPLDFWSQEHYLTQWREAAERILAGDLSAFVTEIHNPDQANFIVWWPAYSFQDGVRLRQQILFLADQQTPFTVDSMYDCVPPYNLTSDDGSRISEWRFPADSVKEFLDSFPQRENPHT